MAFVDFPLQFKRQFSGSLDVDYSFANDAAIDTYASTSALAYDGQMVYSRGSKKAFILFDDGGSLSKKAVGEGEGGIQSDVTGISGADEIVNFITLTKAEYDAIATKDPDTLYLVTDENDGLLLEWSEIDGKPSTFTPSTHTHTASEIVNGTFANARIAQSNVTQHQSALSIGWSQLTGKPSTFTPSAHTHSAGDITTGTFANARIAQGNVTQHQSALSIAWSQLTGIPSTFAPSSHTHSASQITSGTFANARIAQSNVTQHEGALSIGWAQVTGKPSSFTPSSHIHSTSDIVAGTFANARIAQSNVTQHQGALSINWSQIVGEPDFLTVNDKKILTIRDVGTGGGSSLAASRVMNFTSLLGSSGTKSIVLKAYCAGNISSNSNGFFTIRIYSYTDSVGSGRSIVSSEPQRPSTTDATDSTMVAVHSLNTSRKYFNVELDPTNADADTVFILTIEIADFV